MVVGVNARFLLHGKLEGVGLYTHEVLKRMVLSHPEDTFVFFFDRPYNPSFLYAPNVKGVVVSPPARHPLLWWIWFEWSLVRRMKKHNIDVFFTPDGYTSLSSAYPEVMIMHDLAYLHYPAHVPYLVRKYYEHFTPKYLAKSAKIGCVSDATRTDILKHFPMVKDKLFVAYNGCRPEFRPFSSDEIREVRKRYSEGNPYFLFVGALHPRKNVSRMLKAYDRYRRQGGEVNRFVIVGRKAWMTDSLERTYQGMQFRDEVVFPGYLELSELVAVTASAFALLYVSLFEGFGVPMLEAMYCDVPIIASNISSMPEVTGNAAIHVDPLDTDALTKAMVDLEKDQELRNRLVEAGRIQRLKFDWENSARRIYQALKEI